MKLYQKILLAVLGLLVVAGMAIPFLPLGVRYYGFDFNNGIYVHGKRYLWIFDRREIFPSELGTMMMQRRMPQYPELLQEFGEYPMIPMRKAPPPPLPPNLRTDMLKMTFQPGVVPKISDRDVLEFRDEILNKYGTRETIERAIAQGEARGGYIPDALFERK